MKILLLILISFSAFAQNADGSEKTIKGKRDQLFRVINSIREKKGMQPLSYKTDDQPLADQRAKDISKVFKPDTLTCSGEVLFRGTYGQIVSQITTISELSYQYDPTIEIACVGIVKRKDRYYAIVRVF